jgi:hypothetical protein
MSYEVYRMNRIDNNQTQIAPVDAFICFYTHENRSLNALLKLSDKDLISDAFLLSFEDINAATDIQTQNIPILPVKVEKNLSTNILPCLREINNYIKNKNRIGVDVSCMPIPFIAQLLHFLFRHHKDKMLTIYYTEPSYYTLNNLFDYSAYSGEIDIKTIPGFEGETSHIDEVKRVVFYIMGFEMSYLNKLIPQDVNPNKIAPINGFPSYFSKYKDISLINNNTNFFERDVEIIFSEANNPFETFNTMLILENKYRDYRIDIIPVGSKPMALGACLFALKNVKNSCRIIFPFPSEYKPNQSTGCGKLWEYQLLNSNLGVNRK